MPDSPSSTASTSDAQPPLRLSNDRRYLVDAAAEPFFFLADTAWSVVWKGQPDQWVRYLDRRREQGFSVVQVNLLPWRADFVDVDGNAPFVGGDITRPNEAYFARYDQFIGMATERGIFTCLMLVWGGPRPELPASWFTAEQAAAFARWAVERYTRYPMLWSISGDGPYDQDAERWEAVGAAVEDADPNDHPTTNHLVTSRGWRFLHHESSWHDFHMIQTGHRLDARPNIRDQAFAYYRARPTKAYVNGEPWYEAHPDMSDRPRYGPLFGEEHQRYAFWVSVLSGATMGHTYGGQGIWNWKRPGDDEAHVAGPQIGPTWDVALGHPGAAQVAASARVLRSLPWYRLRPTPERARSVDRDVPPVRQPACAQIQDELWLVYCPVGSGGVELLGLDDRGWTATWIDPRTGDEQAIGALSVPDIGEWVAPAAPSAEDWVLKLSRLETA
jgi:Protein of unknown function (DUF4038)/Putative collagen-binding domain of a collagenase